MNAKRVNAAAGVVLAAMKTKETAAGIAAALESACMLQSPETTAELVARRNDALNMRGALSPNGFPRRVPMPLGETLAPAVEWLLDETDRLRARVAELEAAVGDGGTRTVDEDPIAYALTVEAAYDEEADE